MEINEKNVAAHPDDATADYAGFWIRMVAALIDTVILMVLSGALMLLTGDTPGIVFGLNFFISAAYYISLESGTRQATIGKQLMRLRVTDVHHGRISREDAAIRFFSKIPSAILLFAGFLMVFFDSKGQGLHDKIAGTIVLKQQEL